MKGVCGIVIDKDKIFLGFASHEKNQLHFLEEVELAISRQGTTLVEHMRLHAESINACIKDKEKDLGISVDKIFCVLPWEEERRCVAEDIIVLAKRKKVTAKDIIYVKKYLEDIFLNWDDYCIHHLVFHYDIDGNIFKNAPLKVLAKKIKLKSLLLWMREKDYKDVKDIFDNLEREFAGFVSSRVAALPIYGKLAEIQKPLFVCAIGYDVVRGILYQDGNISLEKEYAFGMKQLYEEIGKHCGISSLALCEEVFSRYGSFKDSLLAKEVRIKDGESYIHLSTNALNTFIKEFFTRVLGSVMSDVKAIIPGDMVVSLWGRVCVTEGFFGFLEKSFPFPVVLPSRETDSSCTYGCIYYGVTRALECDTPRQGSLTQRVLSIYREYF